MAVAFKTHLLNRIYTDCVLHKNISSLLLQITRCYRQIKMEKDGDVTVIKGEISEDQPAKLAEKHFEDDSCPLRSRGIKITPEDVLILNQFITSSGEILAQSDTGLSTREYYKVVSCIKQAQRANMLPGEEPQTDIHGNYAPKLNRYLTRYQIGSPLKVMNRGPWYRKIYYKIGDERVRYDSPRVSNKRLALNH